MASTTCSNRKKAKVDLWTFGDSFQIDISNFDVLIIFPYTMFWNLVYLILGGDFCHLATQKESSMTHTKDFCEKDVPDFEELFSGIDF